MAVDGIALHLALASLAGAAAIVTYDQELAGAALKIGLHFFPSHA
jgi:predicted nucleic acid-binding protein